MSNHSRTPKDVHELVAALGGPGAVAALLDVRPTAVANWTAYNAVPPRWFFAISDALKKQGVEVDRGIFRAHSRTERPTHARRTAQATTPSDRRRRVS